MLGLQAVNQLKQGFNQVDLSKTLMKKRFFTTKSKSVIDISRNENPYGASPYAIQAGVNAFKTAHLYPDPTLTKLRASLAKKNNVHPDQIMVAPGTEAILSTLPQAFTTEYTDRIVFPKHSFYRYGEIAKSYNIDALVTNETVESGVNMKSLFLGSRMDDVKIVQLANPANPTGLIVNKDVIKSFLDNLPSDILFVHDAAYAEFCESPKFSDGVEFIKDYPNVLVLKTMSKAYGLAGVRVGYGVGSTDVIQRINDVRPNYWMPASSQSAAIAALDDTNHIQHTVDQTIVVRERFQATLASLNLSYIPSQANFVLVEFDKNGWPDADIAKSMLSARKVIVRSMAGTYNLNNYLRFSIGTNQQMHHVSDALHDIKDIFNTLNKY